VVSGNYTQGVTVTSLAADWLRLAAQTTWKRGINRSGTAAILTEFTDWRTSGSIGNWSSITQEGTYTDGGTPLFSKAAIAGNFLFVAGDTDSGGDGLYAFDISSTSSPSRIASTFNLGSTGYAVAVRGKRLYVLTGDSGAELKAYDITTPGTLSAASLVTSYDVPGSVLGRAMVLNGTKLLVGAAYSGVAGENEFYEFDISNSGSIVLSRGMDDTSAVNAIAVTGTAAYLASSHDTGELRVVNMAGTGALRFATGSGYNLSDRTADGLSIVVTGTSALLGTQANAGIQEMVLFDTENAGVPVPPPVPWDH